MGDPLLRFRQLATVFDYLSIGVLMLSTGRKVKAMNASAELITGLREAEAVGRPCHDVFLDVLCAGDCPLGTPLQKLQKPVSFEVSVPDGEGGTRSLTKIVCPIPDDDGRTVGCMEVFQDYSPFKDLISRVRYEDRRLKMILDNLDIGVLTVDRGGHITFFNRMAQTITGYPREEILGKTCAALFGDPLCPEFSLLEEGGGEGSKLTREGELVTREQRVIPIRADYMALKNESGRTVGGLATLTDLSLLYQLNSAIKEQYTFYDVVGRDPAMQKIFKILPVISASDATVLVEGPTGTGKDLLARVIHTASDRAGQPMVKVNCAALPDTLLESEMFGYARGAFTGADRDKPGRFQDADGGTIFLDEIGDLPLSLQAKLLQVLESREFYPLGSRKTVKVDVRIVAATNQDLESLVKQKRFREDLFYRLNVIRIDLPPLRERRADIPLLISHIVQRLRATRSTTVEEISPEAMEVLLNYDYPGNIREMENILEHALIICQGGAIERDHLPLSLIRKADPMARPEPSKEPVREPGPEPPDTPAGRAGFERDRIMAALGENRFHMGRTAEALKMHRSTLWRKIKKYGIEV